VNKLQKSPKQLDQITTAILSAWHEGHGGSADQAYVFQGDEGIVLMIPKALYQAELNLLRYYSSGSKLLDRYLRSLLETVAIEVSLEIEECLDQKIDQAIPLVDMSAGWAIIFYRFKNSPEKNG
jgi:hypothetical protein